MLYLKKYFTEGLIQMAILLSLCGVRVDVGLEPYLPPSLHEMILGPTSALTQTQFHNLRNRLEDGHSLHPKSVDLDGFFTTRRLLGWVHSLDRLQVPHAELETWLVQREPDPLPVERTGAVVERDQTAPPADTRAGFGMLEEEDEDDKEECLSLLGETFPFSDNQQSQLCDGGDRTGDTEHQPQLSPIIPSEDPSLDLELEWQDILAIMEPEIRDVDMMASFDHVLDSRQSRIFNSVRSDALPRNPDYHDNSSMETDQEVPLMEAPLQHGLLGSPGHLDLEPALLPLIPSAELSDHSSDVNTRDSLKNAPMNPTHRPPDHMGLLPEDPSEDFDMELNEGNTFSTFSMNLLPEDPVDNMESSPCSRYAPCPENLAEFDFNVHSSRLPSSNSTPPLERNGMAQDQDLVTSPSGVFLFDGEDDVEDEDGLPSPLNELLEDAILDEIRLLDLALEEGFSPEMAARLEDEGYLNHEIVQKEPDQLNHSMTSKDQTEETHSGPGLAVTEEQVQLRRPHQDADDEADSDSGLSLDFSHSPASPCTSEASSYSSSSSTSSCSSSSSKTSTSSCVSNVGSPFSENEDEDAEDRLVGSDLEVEMTIKEEKQEEEELGAVGGGYSENLNKFFPFNYGDHKMFNGFPWLEHVDHDHTYNQPLSSASSPSPGKITTKHTKSSLQHHNEKPYHRSPSRHITESQIWSRDERRAQALKIPFSNAMIVNLPVEEFNELLASYELNEEQLTLVRDIRRRGKNKIAAQNCRQRKLGVLQGLEEDVSGMRRRRSRLLREKQEALRNLQEMKHRLSMLYQEVFSRLRDEAGRPLDTAEHSLQFGLNGSVTVAPRQQGAGLPLTGEKSSKKQRGKKK